MRRVVVLAWIAFLARGLFYCVEMPLWEGYDEWAHFAYIQYFAAHGQPPLRTDPPSHEVAMSLAALPLPYTFRDWPPPRLTHEAYWALSPEERQNRLESPAAGSSDLAIYEVQQPPLYYLLLAPLHVALSGTSLVTRVMAMRIASLLLASLVVPVAYRMARGFFGNSYLTAACPALLALMPGLMIDVCRVANDSLAIILLAALLGVTLRASSGEPSLRTWLLIGLLLGAALLTKAYALALVPLPVALCVLSCRRDRVGRNIAGMCAALGAAALMAGWWYAQSWLRTGGISGEQVAGAASGLPMTTKLAAVTDVRWLAALDSIAFSHIWMGGWSFLVVRSWMYRVFELLAGLGAAGFLVLVFRGIARRFRSRTGCGLLCSRVLLLALAYALFCSAMAYHTLMLFLVYRRPLGFGWYLYAVVPAEVILMGIGLCTLFGRRRTGWIAALAMVLFAALDLYTMHFLLIPYHAGVIAHTMSGSLPAFHVQDLDRVGVAEVVRRISSHASPLKSSAMLVVCWAAYFASTIVIVGVFVRYSSKREPWTLLSDSA